MPDQDSGIIYDVNDRPPLSKNLLFALQQFLAIVSGTILVPILVNSAAGTEVLNQASALLGAGFGTLTYIILTKFKSPIFLGSNFEFIPALTGSLIFGYFGFIIGGVVSGLIYVVIALIVKMKGTAFIDRFFPVVIIGPVISLIGLGLAASAVQGFGNPDDYVGIAIGVITFLVTVYTSVRIKPLSLYPFLMGIIAGYIIAAIFTAIGTYANIPDLMIIDYSPFETIGNFDKWIPHVMILDALEHGAGDMSNISNLITVLILFIPISLIAFTEHIAAHKNMSAVIHRDLLKDPGIVRTLLGDGLGSVVGSLFCGIPNTTYSQSISCVSLTRNAAVRTTIFVAILAIISSFIYPFIILIQTIPNCVISGISIALYGYIVVLGISMLKDVDLSNLKNIYVVSSILIVGVGGMTISFCTGGSVITISYFACALIMGIVVNLILGKKKGDDDRKRPDDRLSKEDGP